MAGVFDLGTLIAKLGLDNSGFKGGIDDSVKSLSGLKSAMEAAASAAGFYAVTSAVESLAKEAEAATLVAKELELTISRTGSTASVAAIKQLADETSKLAAVDDEAALSAATMLIRFGATEQQVKQMMPVLADMSAKTGDIEGAAMAVGRAMNGQTRGLMQYGIFMKQAEGQTISFADVTNEAMRTVGGNAALYSNTIDGMERRASTAAGNVRESIGAIFTDSTYNMHKLVAEAMEKIADAASKMDESTKVLIQFGATLATVVTGLGAFVGVMKIVGITSLHALAPILVVITAVALALESVYAVANKMERSRSVLTPEEEKRFKELQGKAGVDEAAFLYEKPKEFQELMGLRNKMTGEEYDASNGPGYSVSTAKEDLVSFTKDLFKGLFESPEMDPYAFGPPSGSKKAPAAKGKGSKGAFDVWGYEAQQSAMGPYTPGSTQAIQQAEKDAEESDKKALEAWKVASDEAATLAKRNATESIENAKKIRESEAAAAAEWQKSFQDFATEGIAKFFGGGETGAMANSIANSFQSSGVFAGVGTAIGAAVAGPLGAAVGGQASSMIQELFDSIIGSVQDGAKTMLGGRMGEEVSSVIGGAGENMMKAMAVNLAAGVVLGPITGGIAPLILGALTPIIAAAAPLVGAFFDMAQQTKAFGQAQNYLDKSFENIILALEPLVANLIPFAVIVGDLITAFAKMLGIFMGTPDIFYDLYKVVRFFATGILDITKFIQEGMAGFLFAISAMLGAIPGNPLKDFGENLNKTGDGLMVSAYEAGVSSRNMKDMSWSEAMLKGTTDDLNKELQESLTNIPTWYNTALGRKNASQGGGILGGYGSSSSSGSGSGGVGLAAMLNTAGAPTTNKIVNIGTIAVTDAKAFAAEIEAIFSQREYRTTGTYRNPSKSAKG